jgi:hypothetical protein
MKKFKAINKILGIVLTKRGNVKKNSFTLCFKPS